MADINVPDIAPEDLELFLDTCTGGREQDDSLEYWNEGLFTMVDSRVYTVDADSYAFGLRELDSLLHDRGLPQDLYWDFERLRPHEILGFWVIERTSYSQELISIRPLMLIPRQS